MTATAVSAAVGSFIVGLCGDNLRSTMGKKPKSWVWFRSTLHPETVTNKGLGWDSLLKMVHNPGGDWNPVWGVDPRYDGGSFNEKKGTRYYYFCEKNQHGITCIEAS